ncbi:MAG: PspC domain-containing protein [Oscillospiraceae bacterium]|nr:PspC domain-containing protein [Oscillospiraceae bacterium]
MQKKLYRSNHDKKIAGVCGGIAEYLGCDPTIVRIISSVLILTWFPALVIYTICAFVVPIDPNDTYVV